MRGCIGRGIRGLAALFLAAGLAGTAQAAPTWSTGPTLSNSGRLEFYVSSAVCDTCDTAIEVVAQGADAFLIRNATTGQPLVTAGEDLFLEVFVVALNGFTLDKWMAQLVGAPNGSAGESITDQDVTPGFGLGTMNIAGDMTGTVNFAYSTTMIQGLKDLNALRGEIGGMIQGLIPTAVPEPGSLALLAAGLFGLGAVVRRRA